jgi:hypothetical protein
MERTNVVDLSLELDGHRATIRATGYLSLQASENLCILLRDLGRMDILELCLDLSQCSPVCVGALETLLDTKFRLANEGVALEFERPPHTVSRVFQIMGLGANGELPTDGVSLRRSNS